MKIKLSESDWKNIGIKMGWLKEAQARFDDIVGYTYDADAHSPEQAKADLASGVLKATNPNAPLDEHGIPESGVEDSEGNEIHPVFAGSEDAKHLFGEDEEDEDSFDDGDFSYLTDGHEDDARMIRLRQKAESLAGMYDDAGDVHVALYWLLSNIHGGQNSPEYAALSSSPYSPGPMENGPRGEAKMMYRELMSAYKGA